MTTRKGFKRLVRDRMARTGERYAAARRALMTTDGGEFQTFDRANGSGEDACPRPAPSKQRIAGHRP